MSDVVFLLGAGASATAGAPLMSNFLDRAHDLWRLKQVAAEESFAATFGAIGELQRVHSKADLDLQNLEAVFGALEMAQTLASLGSLPPESVSCLTSAISDVIVQTLEATMLFPVSSDGISPTVEYLLFVDLLDHIQWHSTRPRTASVLTFNYDIGLDWALEFKNQPVKYGLEEETPPTPGLFKLHGSLNWAYCQACRNITPRSVRTFLQNAPGWALGARNVRIAIGSTLAHCAKCKATCESHPVIVPPPGTKRHFTTQSPASGAVRRLRGCESFRFLTPSRQYKDLRWLPCSGMPL
jgi:hypothetical protein